MKSRNLFVFLVALCNFAISQNNTLLIDNNTQSSDEVINQLNNKGDYKVVLAGVDFLELSQLINDLSEYQNIHHLEIKDYQGQELPKQFCELTDVNKVTFHNCKHLNQKKLYRLLANMDQLDSLEIVDCSMGEIHQSIGHLEQLTSLSLSGEVEEFDAVSSVQSISRIDGLKNLSLANNDLDGIPQEIQDLPMLESLNLSNNNLSDLPDGIAQLSQLKELKLDNNTFNNPIQELSRINSNVLNYVSMNSEITVGEMEQLQLWFPKATIDIASNAPPAAEIKDSIAKKDINYGQFQINTDSFKILSEAYQHYPRLFSNQLFATAFDSTLFDERYQSPEYMNTKRIMTEAIYSDISLHIYRRGNKGEVWFDFYQRNGFIRRSSSSYRLNRSHPELNAFRNMVWVSAENMTKKEFKSKYMFLPKTKWYLPKLRKFYGDIRIYYEDGDARFTMQLKDFDGFTDLSVYPRYPNRNKPITDSQDRYLSSYISYGKSLQRRERRFHRALHRNASKYNVMKQRTEMRKWAEFQKTYMSEEEKKMSQEEWLVYYDAVVANERQALNTGEANVRNISRTLDLDGFSIDSPYNFSANNSTKCVNAIFKDQLGNQLAVTEILVINKMKLTYTNYRGSLGVRPVKIYFEDPANTVVFVRLRNGDTAIMEDGLDNILEDADYGENRDIAVNILEEKFSSVQQSRNLMGL